MSSSLPTVASALHLEGSTALLGLYLYLSVCSLLLVQIVGSVASALQLEGSTSLCALQLLLVHIVGLRQVLLHDFVLLLVHMVHGASLRLVH